MPDNILRKIPKVDAILEDPGFKALSGRFPGPVLKEVLREYLDFLRLEIKSGAMSAVPAVDGGQLRSSAWGMRAAWRRLGHRRRDAFDYRPGYE